MKYLKKALALLLMLVFVGSGVLSHVGTISRVEAASAKISVKKKTLNQGQNVKLTVTGAKGTIKWSVSNDNVKLNKTSGKKVKVTAVKAGNSKVTAKVKGKKLTCSIKVNGLNIVKKELKVGQKFNLQLKGLGKKVKWSQKGGVVTVKGNKAKAIVTAKKAGTGTVVAKVGKKDYKCSVVVTEHAKEPVVTPQPDQPNPPGDQVQPDWPDVPDKPDVPEVSGNRVAAIRVDYIKESPLNFVTKVAYAGGSTVTFDAFVPEGITGNGGWWGAAPIADPSAVDIYVIAGGYSLYDAGKVGEWATYTLTLPNDGNNYYIVIGGACGTGSNWVGKTLFVDNFKVTGADGTAIAEDDFNHTFAEGLFNVDTEGIDYAVGSTTTAVTLENVECEIIPDIPEVPELPESMDPLENVDFLVEVESGREPVILHFSDTQIIDAAQERYPDRLNSGGDNFWATDKINERLYDSMTETIENTNPDLILITGDLVYGEFDDNGTMFQSLVNKMESYGVPWAPVFGNHDNESAMGVDWQCELLENAEHCLFKQRTLTGNGNYTVGIKQDGELKRVFFMMDSNGCGEIHANSLVNGHTVTYNGFGQDQMDWSIALAEKLNEISPNTKISYAFHIQLAAFADAYAKYGFTNSGTKENPININKLENKAEGDFGYIGQNLKDPWDRNNVFFNRMKAVGVDSIFVGHEHWNGVSVVHEGIRFQFGQKMGSYERTNFVKNDGTIYGSSCVLDTPLSGGVVLHMAEDGSFKNDGYIYFSGDAQAKLDGTYGNNPLISVNGLQNVQDFYGDEYIEAITPVTIAGQNAWRVKALNYAKVYIDLDHLKDATKFTFSVYVPEETTAEVDYLFAIRVKPNADEPSFDGSADGYIKFSAKTNDTNRKIVNGTWQTFTIDITGLSETCTEFAFNIYEGNLIYLKDIAFGYGEQDDEQENEPSTEVNGLQNIQDFYGDTCVETITVENIDGYNAWRVKALDYAKVYIDLDYLKDATKFTFSVYVPEETTAEVDYLFAMRVKPNEDEPSFDGTADGYIKFSAKTSDTNRKIVNGTWQTFTIDITGLSETCTEFAFNIYEGNLIYLKDIAFE